jgi:3-deoxy-D-manno-octulosonic-acid transferase
VGAALLTIYGALLPLLRRLLELAASFSAGAEELLAPRRGLLERWRKAELGDNRIWVHVSSVGELEQARPVMEILGSQGYSVVLSFFSPSVPRLVKDWSFVRHADFLPLDFPEEMAELVRIISPRMLVLNRYDLWPNHLQAVRQAGIPVVMVNASTPPQGWFGALSLWIRRSLFQGVDAWTFVDAAAAAGWEPYVLSRVKGLVTGDPRVDRALGRVERALGEGRSRERLSLWRRRPFCLVAGSTWPEDEEILLGAWKRLDLPRSLMIVPHEPEEAHLRKLEAKLGSMGLSHLRFSRLESETDADVLVVDGRGMLAELYGTGQLAYVGGGFGRQIHSVIEPVAHGLPVAIGPCFNRSPEAITLVATGSIFAIPERKGSELLARWIREMAHPGEARARAEEPLRIFLQIHKGAGRRVADFLDGLLSRKAGANESIFRYPS